jgi:hypothetical protein
LKTVLEVESSTTRLVAVSETCWWTDNQIVNGKRQILLGASVASFTA